MAESAANGLAHGDVGFAGVTFVLELFCTMRGRAKTKMSRVEAANMYSACSQP